jgi:cob(I)alamin adenosyltransferase
MSIVTKTGDSGTTGLMYNRRVPKSDPRVEAYGTVDELNAALGMARATATEEFIRSNLLEIQKQLVVLMGELATAVEDLPRYVKDGFTLVGKEMTARLESAIHDVEARGVSYKGWATPGANPHAASLDLARTVCRRAERCVCALEEAAQLHNDEMIIFLNRLSDLLWLFARLAEHQP